MRVMCRIGIIVRRSRRRGWAAWRRSRRSGFWKRKGTDLTPVFEPLAERLKPGKRLQILLTVGRLFVRHNVVDVANRKALHFDTAAPGVIEGLDAIRSENQIQVEGTILELDEILAAPDLTGLLLGQAKAKVGERIHQSCAVCAGFFDEEVGILGSVGVPEQDRSGLADEEIAHAPTVESRVDFLGLPILKRGHSRAILADCFRTIGGTRPSCQTSDTAHRPGLACRCG